MAEAMHADLLARRGGSDRLDDELLAPLEHRAFAREYVGENPVSGAIGVGAAIPAYQLAKLLGLGGEGATPASWDQLFGGYHGILEGLRSSGGPR